MIRQFLFSFILSFFGILLIIGLYVLFPSYLYKHFKPQEIAFIHKPSQPSATPLPTPLLKPATLLIPKLKIQTAIEPVGLTTTNNMDVPKNAAHVGWYMHGPYPSEVGNAVIAGHLDTPSGKPAIFYNLEKLEIGDVVEVISENAVRSTFIVKEKSTIAYDSFPEDFVFNNKTGVNLNLITCGGVWDAKKKTYTDRIVIYTTLTESNL